jgi:Caspase domain
MDEIYGTLWRGRFPKTACHALTVQDPRMTFLRRFFTLSTACAALVGAPVLAHAEEPNPTPPPAVASTVPHPFAYGILVGTNVGGAGQQTLRYAEDDARKMADVLRQLGRYGNADLRVLVRPDSKQLLATIDDVAAKMRAHQAKGEQAVLVFYYSGHARAGSFSLGGEELAVTTLREKLQKVPSTLTLVVLDACQSGQFARFKGVEPAADFSYNSVSRLTTKGIAVMASSSAQELSQESDELKASYFTHHLIVALRGAADADGDGRVSLDEAYKYAYRRTLASTSQTQVGGQHVTLETDLAGQGDVPVTYPADARSQLELPGPLEARIIVQQKPSGTVVAEVQKAKGAPLRLAFVAGAYEAIVRDTASLGKVLRCPLTLSDERVVALDFGSCQNVRITSKGLIKGEDEPDDPEPDVVTPAPTSRPISGWNIEGGFGFMSRVEDGFTRNLDTFGYKPKRGILELPRGRASLGVSKGFLPHLTVGLQLTTLGGDTYVRSLGQSDDKYTLNAYGGDIFVRVSTELFGHAQSRKPYLDLYGQVGAGMTLGFSTLTTGSTQNNASETATENDVGYFFSGAAGVAIVRLPVSVFFQAGYDYAPTTKNLIGDVHDAGGPSGQLGLRFQFGQ